MLSITDNGPFAPCPAPFNMAAYVLSRADARADKIALAVLGPYRAERWSYARLKASVLGTATGLLQSGLRPGDIALMRLGNSVDFPVAYLGAIAAGIVPVPTSSQLTLPEVTAMLNTLRPAAVLHDPDVAMPNTDIPAIDLADLRAMRDLPEAAFHLGDPNRMAYAIYTSGTSGSPRAVAHAHRAIWARQMMFDGWYGLTEDDRLCHAGAFNWTYTLGTGLMDPWTMGATALIPAPGTEITQIPLLLKRHEATIFAAAPGVYRKMLKGRDTMPLPALRHGLCAGEKLPDAVRNAWEQATGTQLHEAFGMSECSTFLSGSPDQPALPGTLGRAQPGRKIAILGAQGPVPQGDEGEIAVAQTDPGVMLEYLNAPEDTAARFCNGWFLTGDRGAMDGGSNFTYLGRADDMMNAGGYRVSPIEVETALSHAPGIHEIAATDVEIKPGTRVIAAFYTADAPLDDDTLTTYGETRLARYKQPRLYIHVPALPRGTNNKLLRRKLREDYEASHGKT